MQHSISGTPTPTFSGSIDTRRLDLERFRVLDVTFPPDMQCGEHYHDQPSMAVVLYGSISKRYRRREHDSSSNSVYSTPAGEPHRLRVGEAGMRALIVEPISADLRLLAPFDGLFDRVTVESRSLAPLLARQVAAELRTPDNLTPLVVDGLVLSVLSAALRGDRTRDGAAWRPAWLERVEQRLHDEFRSRVSIGELAGEVGVHPVHLARVFRQQHGTTPGAYLRRLRVEWSAAQLAATRLPLNKIAQQAGFADQSHFTRAFKQQMGTTPGRYRVEMQS